MSTSGIQNYLSNVFRQVYTYDSNASLFTPRLELSNIDSYSGNTMSVFTAAVGDAACNVYVGSNAGNSYTLIKSCRNVTAVGYGAGNNISNVSNSVYLGYDAGTGIQGANAVIAIGAASIGGGTSNIAIGNGTGTVGTSNILIGHAIAPGNVSSQIRIGHSNRIPIAANVATNWVGLGGVLAPTFGTSVDISGNTRVNGNIGINTIPVFRTLDVSGTFRATSGLGYIDLSTNQAIRLEGNVSINTPPTTLSLDISGAFRGVKNGNTVSFDGGALVSTGGYVSIQSNISAGVGVTTIGTLRRGIIHVTAVDQASSANRAAFVYFAWTTSNVTALSSAINGDTTITTSSTDIQIANITSTKTYDYSITYFPLT